MALQLTVFFQVQEAKMDLNTQPGSDQMHAYINITSKDSLPYKVAILEHEHILLERMKNLEDEPFIIL